MFEGLKIHAPNRENRDAQGANLYESDLVFREVGPADLSVHNLVVKFSLSPSLLDRLKSLCFWKGNHNVEPAKKTALDGVSASFPPGSLTAILGGSGSGKTTLLNAISNRVSAKNLSVNGDITFNGGHDPRDVRSAYVMQQDVLLPTLTVRETLQYAADLRLPSPSTKDERRAVVEQVILELGLKECAETRIGNNIHKGCSGGEKRRTSIGVQMLANPSVLYCDEPTTGLDAYNALQVIRTLKRLAENGRTVIASIHAPRSEIWTLLDRVILLSRGSALYSGQAGEAIDWFKKCGHKISSFVNPAEFLIDVSAIDNRTQESEEISLSRFEKLRNAWQVKIAAAKSSEASSSKEQDKSIKTSQTDRIIDQRPIQVGFQRQVTILTKRTTKTTIRDPMGIAGSIVEAVSMAIITGYIFYDLGYDLQGVRSREGSLYNTSSLQGYLILLYECYRLTFDIQLFDRERSEGVVSVSSFMLSRRLSRFFLEDLVVPTIFTLVYYFMVGYRVNAGEFFVFYAIVVITQFIAVNLGMLCVAVSRHFAGASLIANMAYTLQSLACGYFVQVQQIPVYVRWLKWTAYNFYLFGSLSSNEFLGPAGPSYGHFYDCPFSDNPTDPRCSQYLGINIIESLGLPTKSWIWRPIVVAVSFAIGFYILGWLVLTFWKRDIGIARARKREEDLRTEGDLGVKSVGEVHPVVLGLSNYSLDVNTRRWSQFLKSQRKTILNPISSRFDSGKINVILGPSGSGKTTLLQSIAGRIQSNFTSRYNATGEVTFNGVVSLSAANKALVSLVAQDDDALLPALTVRETLRFAAILRLPPNLPRRTKIGRAEDVILKMGLKDCADNVIGSELKKGISGGEKRRVSIAIQILTDPKVLLLDEPTSGLDAFTAASVMEVLKALANEGRTIIATIHQARSDIYNDFHNILLLSRGGWPVYSGERQMMLPHFENLGHTCRTTSNPADFVLDLITVDFRSQEQEEKSSEKVSALIEAWNSKQTPSNPNRTEKIASDELELLRRQMSPFYVTFPTVLRRSGLNIMRQPDIVLARIMQVVSFGIITTLFFAPLQSDYEAVQSRMGYVQEIAALYFVGMLQNLSVYPVERTLFYREDLDNCYTTFTFLLSYTVLELPFEIIASLIYGALAAFAVGLKRTVEIFFIAAFDCFCIVSCGESVGIMFCTFFSSQEGFAVTIMSVLLSVSNIMGGILSLNMPALLQAFNYISPVKYQIASLANYAMKGQTFTCKPEQREADGNCPINTGEDVLRLYNLDSNAGLNTLGLALCAIVYRLLAFLVLWSARREWKWNDFKHGTGLLTLASVLHRKIGRTRRNDDGSLNQD